MSRIRNESGMRDMSHRGDNGDVIDKPEASFIAAPAVHLLCCLGLLVVFALLSGGAGGLAGWLAGLDIGAIALAVAVGAVTVAWLMRRRRMRRGAPQSAVEERQ